MIQNFRLSDAERNSGLWTRLVQHMEQRIERLHMELEKDIPEETTANRRGRIAALRELLFLDKELPPGE